MLVLVSKWCKDRGEGKDKAHHMSAGRLFILVGALEEIQIPLSVR